MDIFGDAQVLTCLQTRELDVGLALKKKDQILQKAKIYHKEGQYLIKIWPNEHVHVVPHPKVWKSVVKHVHEELGYLGVC
jgi:hypothetical protein